MRGMNAPSKVMKRLEKVPLLGPGIPSRNWADPNGWVGYPEFRTAASRRWTSGRCGASGGRRLSSSSASLAASVRRLVRAYARASPKRAWWRSGSSESARCRCGIAAAGLPLSDSTRPEVRADDGIVGVGVLRGRQRALRGGGILRGQLAVGAPEMRIRRRQVRVDRRAEERRRLRAAAGFEQDVAQAQVRLRVPGIVFQHDRSARSSAAPCSSPDVTRAICAASLAAIFRIGARAAGSGTSARVAERLQRAPASRDPATRRSWSPARRARRRRSAARGSPRAPVVRSPGSASLPDRASGRTAPASAPRCISSRRCGACAAGSSRNRAAARTVSAYSPRGASLPPPPPAT